MIGIKKMSNKTYLVTGGLGFIGSNIVKKIIKRDKKSKCIILDNFTVYIDPLKQVYQDYRKIRFQDIINEDEYRNSRSKRIYVERGDASEAKITTEIIRKYKPEIIFHTAAMPLARLKNAVPLEFRKGSIDTTTNLLECVKNVQDQSNYKLKDFYIFPQVWYMEILRKNMSLKMIN